MSGRRHSSQATDDGETLLECKAAYLSVFEDIRDEIDSKEKLVQVLQQAGRNPTSRTVAKYWKKSTESLSYADFVDICRKEPPTSVDDLMKAFRKIDLNGDGYISVDELMKVLTTKGEKMSRAEVEKMINEVDEDKNGKLDYGEVIEEDHFFYNKKILPNPRSLIKLSAASAVTAQSAAQSGYRFHFSQFCNMVMSTTEECKKKSLKMMERKERKKKKADKEAKMAAQGSQTSLKAESTSQSTTKMGSTASIRSQMAEPKHSPSKYGSTVSLRSQKAVDETQSKEDSVIESTAEKSDEEAESKTEFQTRHKFNEPVTKDDAESIGTNDKVKSDLTHKTQSKAKMGPSFHEGLPTISEGSDRAIGQTSPLVSPRGTLVQVPQPAPRKNKDTKMEEQENKIEAEEEIAEENQGSRVSLKKEKSPQPVPRKESVSKAASVEEMGSKTLLTKSLKSGDNVTDSQTSLRSAGQMGSRRSLISIEKESRAPVPPPRKSLFRTLSEDDLPKPSPRVKKDKPRPGSSIKSSRLSEPPNLREWTHVTSKGAFFFEEDEIVTHLYSLTLTEDTSVYITIQPTEITGAGSVKQKNKVDTMLYVLRSRPDENGKYLVTFTEQRDTSGKYVLRCDLKAGTYQLMPFTTGCRFKQRVSQPKKEAAIIQKDKDDKISITKAFRKALEDIFNLCDLDGNGYLSRDEFNWFNVRTSGEEIADDEWQVVEERVELKDGEITLNGFIQLNEMEAEDSEGDTDDLWMTLSSIGFNKALVIDELCSYRIDVYTEDCDDAEFRVTGIESQAEKLEADICQSIIDKGQATQVKSMKDLVMYTYTSGTRAAIVLDNKSRSTVRMKIDCSKSKNCVSHRGDLDYIMDIGSHSTMVAHHILPEDDSSEWELHCTETVMK